MKRTAFLCVFLLSAVFSLAQNAGPEMADAMYTNGKIYVVVGVVGVIFAGIITYLVLIDRKITTIEKERKQK